MASKGNKRTLTTVATVVIAALSVIPETAPFVPLLIQIAGLFGVTALAHAAQSGSLWNISPDEDEPTDGA